MWVMLFFDKNDLRKQLSSLTHEARIVFGASCCERMLPNYKKFEEIEGWGNTQVFRDVLDIAWRSCFKNELNPKKVELLIEKCYEVLPDEEDFDSIYTSYAINAGSGICSIIEICIDDDLDNLVSIAELSVSTVDLFVQEKNDMKPNDPQLDQKIMQDQLMQIELKNQLDDLAYLKQQDAFDERLVSVFRSRVEGRSNIEL